MTHLPEKPDPRLEKWFTSLRAVPRAPPAQRARRAEFLAAAKSFAPVSGAPQSRLNHWKNTLGASSGPNRRENQCSVR
jgi:hypothetical protein